MKHVFVFETDGERELTEQEFNHCKRFFDRLVPNEVNQIMCSYINQSDSSGELIVNNAMLRGASAVIKTT